MASWKSTYLPPSIRSGQIYSSLSVGPLGAGMKKSSPSLPRVPEDRMVKIKGGRWSPRNVRLPTESQSSYGKLRDSDKGEDWNNLQSTVIGLFKQKGTGLRPGDINRLHHNIRRILESKLGPFFFDYFKQELLAKGMGILQDELKTYRGQHLLELLEITWEYVYTKIVPTLEAIMYPVKTKTSVAIRRATLASFRDFVVIKINLDAALGSPEETSDGIKQMLLVLQNVNDSYPPNKNKLQLEPLVAKIIVPYLGFKGLYLGGTEPHVVSSEPSMLARKKSCEIAAGRRQSRPLSVQPKQLDNLNDLFMMAIRKRKVSQVSSFAR